MPETVEANVQVSTEQTNTEVAPSPFANNAWTENIPETKEEVVVQPVEKKEGEENIISNTSTIVTELEVPKDWLKKEFDIDDPAVLKAEREELKTLKAAPKAEEIKFGDEQSKQIYELLKEGGDKKKEVRKFLETQEQLESVSTIEVNKDNAEEIIKLQMKIKNKQLSPSEIDFEYKQNYVAPKEPVQRTTEPDDEFEERLNEWKERVSSIETRKVIAAKLAQPELEKYKTELVLPELTKPMEQKVNEPDPEIAIKVRQDFLNKLESDFSKAEGFSTQVKDESVEIPVAFKIPDDIKAAIKGRLEKSFDVESFYLNRWFGENGEPKITEIISDIYLLENHDKVLSGVANNAANLRLEEFKKQMKNIDLNGKTNQQTFQPNADGKANISPFKQEAWSENPPAVLS